MNNFRFHSHGIKIGYHKRIIMKKVLLVVCLSISVNLHAQIEAGFIMAGNDIRVNKDKSELIETYNYFTEDPKTKVKVFSGSAVNREIKNVERGIYLSTAVGQTWVGGVAKNYLQSVTEAKFEYGNNATFAYTTFGSEGTPDLRTNCKVNQAWGVFNQQGRRMNCITATPKLCTYLEKLKSKSGSVDFNKLSSDLSACSSTLTKLGFLSRDLNDYVRSKDYREVAGNQANNAHDFINNSAEEFKMKKMETFAPNDIEFFNAKSLAGTLDLKEISRSMQNLSDASVACAAMVDAGKVQNDLLGRKTAVDPITGGIATVPTARSAAGAASGAEKAASAPAKK